MNATELLNNLLGRLWEAYKKRVSYARIYNQMVLERGGKMTNDHIAFRTFNADQGQPSGIEALSRIFKPLGYYKAGEYHFKEKKLYAEHFLHEDPLQPKIFISQLEVGQLPQTCQEQIASCIGNSVDPLTANTLKLLDTLEAQGSIRADQSKAFLDNLFQAFARPWEPPLQETVLAVDKISQYAAWTLLHGNSVNHFTAYINEQNVKEWKGDIEVTMDALRAAGVPIKKEIEGARGTKLRQSSTEAVVEPCPVREKNGSIGSIEWTYAYYELLERHEVADEKGNKALFTGFLGEQATNLFEMTKKAGT